MRVLSDFLLGVRLAFGSGRLRGVAMVRTSLTAVGIGLAVAGLLLVFGAFNGLQERLDRIGARTPVEAEAGEPVLDYLSVPSYYRDRELTAVYLEPRHEDAPVPPGLGGVPAQGQAVVSPALAELLDSDEGALLRPRFTDLKIVGIIAEEGVAEPDELWYYVGGQGLREAWSTVAVGDFGVPVNPLALGPFWTVVQIIVGAVLVSPLLVLITSSSRLASADNERRLSAVRLVGADAAQIRRIAAAESVVGAGAGLVLAVGFFFAGRPLIAAANLGGLTLYPEALVPAWEIVVAVAVLAPLLAVGSALFGLRDVIVEPYGVVRDSESVPRRGRWRVTLVVVGVALFFPDVWGGMEPTGVAAASCAGAGSILLLVGVPVLMPWLTERLVRRLRGGPPSWQLGVRRLQLDAGTPARVVAGITVVLAGAVTVQTVFGAVTAPERREAETVSVVTVSEGDAEAVPLALLGDVPGLTPVSEVRFAVDPGVPDAVEHLRNALAPLGWRAQVYWEADRDGAGNPTGTLRVLIGTALAFTLLLSGGNLVVLTSAQVLQRRRALAALRATGVPRGVLGRSLLWQNGIPVVVGVGVASGVGVGAAGLLTRLLDTPFRLDWGALAAYAVTAVVVVGVVTAASGVALRAVEGETSLRGE
ncbi:FtsX-like permease family protein [Saccharomonospora cyanea]|uniref:Putative permease n=1 Tax=Saccharomonospora cyanea NA-134 TaxID=882082 RepID=H5XE22_9PSEU|nr:FtsX-like permease family protein [Saccharomonospora cyanea]EHR59253.1 putative permease [Saccharomonospora cyanea NA-134]